MKALNGSNNPTDILYELFSLLEEHFIFRLTAYPFWNDSKQLYFEIPRYAIN